MKERKELIQSKSYWLTKIQIDVFNLLNTYMEENNFSQKQVAEQLKVSPSYVSQIINGNFNFTIAKLIELSLAVGKVPLLNFENYAEFLQKESEVQHAYSYALSNGTTVREVADVLIPSTATFISATNIAVSAKVLETSNYNSIYG